jgi:hypothetical protein
MSAPRALNDAWAASALTVLTDRFNSARILKSGQIRKTGPRRPLSCTSSRMVSPSSRANRYCRLSSLLVRLTPSATDAPGGVFQVDVDHHVVEFRRPGGIGRPALLLLLELGQQRDGDDRSVQYLRSESWAAVPRITQGELGHVVLAAAAAALISRPGAANLAPWGG